jgi:hypothetical protein
MIRSGYPAGLIVAAVVPLLAATAQAQDAGKIGITVQYPSSIGVLWHASNRIALRPDVTFSGSSSNSPDGLETSSSWNVGAEFAVVVYLKQYEHVRTYVAPRFDYGYTHTTLNITATPSTSGSRWGAGGSGLFGAEYAPVTRFTVFAEIGFGYSHSTIPALGGPSATGGANSWGAKAAVGAVFYP